MNYYLALWIGLASFTLTSIVFIYNKLEKIYRVLDRNYNLLYDFTTKLSPEAAKSHIKYLAWLRNKNKNLMEE